MGCRKKRKKEEMVRFIKRSDGVLFTDEEKNLNGRGYYLCPNPICLKLAQKKRRRLEFLKSTDYRSPSVESFLNG
jgi:predicted RNA-binding protein YlxR (DUF448 family)